VVYNTKADEKNALKISYNFQRAYSAWCVVTDDSAVLFVALSFLKGQ
jgi:hypothetical protein